MRHVAIELEDDESKTVQNDINGETQTILSGDRVSDDQHKLVNDDSSISKSIQDGVQKQKKEDLFFTRRMLAIRRIIWPKFLSIETLLMFVQICLSCGYAWSYVEMSINAGEILTAVNEQNTSSFAYWVLWTGGMLLVGSLSNAAIVCLGNYMCLTVFRRRLTHHLTDKYMQRKTYFKMIHLDRRIEDPETRLVFDIHTMCLKMKLILFGAPMYVGYIATTVSLVYFFATLLQETGWFVPVLTVATFIASTLISQLLAIKPARISRKYDDVQSEYISSHSYFAMHSEHVAFLDGHEREKQRMDEQLNELTKRNTQFSVWTFPLNFVTILYYWGNQWFCYIIPGLAWLWTNNVEITDYTTLVNVSATLYGLLWTMTTYLLLFQEMSELAASTSRVGEYMEILDQVYDDKSLDGDIEFKESDGAVVELVNVTLNRPGSSKVLLENVTFKVDKSNSIVIMGPSGIGKSSLLRVIGGLWPANGGVIYKPFNYGRNGVMFIPQKPYLTHDTLEAQIVYPHSVHQAVHVDENWSYDVFVALLREVGLEYILKQFPNREEVRHWSQVLSVGEQQRVGIARILYHLPAVVVMDESTSAMDEPVEEQVFMALKKRGIGLLSVAHRSTVKKFHDHVFIIDRDGNWKMELTA
eukprot:CAMPEP_0197021052 /NCGR_PEP_ID=MMETSP1384-20130603/1940_1 /TAXON_ID=29189 /ORGANISM="Ammonia sp." /LENGTH=640 /DNA_ID=CAMNT_0042448801 /DNA_START=97 /DNA_END=2019 /DNA_ORIENTATION=+